MKEKEFIGKNSTEEEKSLGREALSLWSEESRKALEGESEKTEENIKIVEVINFLIEKELKSIGIEGYVPIDLEQVHFLPDEVFSKNFPDFKGAAFFRSTNDAVYVNQDKMGSKALSLYTMLHESIHRASTQKFYRDKEKNIYDSRVGYRISSPWKEADRQNRLRGFNEMINDYTVYKIFLKNPEKLKELGISKEDIKGPIYSYMAYGPIFESILNKVSELKGISQLEVFDDLERGQFENSILVLKDIEKAFGRDSLEVLSYLEVIKNEEGKELDNMIKGFFLEEDDVKRSELGVEIQGFFNRYYKDKE